MPSFFRKPKLFSLFRRQADGFILIEVLVAMSLVTSAWVALEGSYYRLVLRMGQIQNKKTEVNKELDQHEIEFFTGKPSADSNPKVSINESTRVSRRPRSIPDSVITTDQK